MSQVNNIAADQLKGSNEKLSAFVRESIVNDEVQANRTQACNIATAAYRKLQELTKNVEDLKKPDNTVFVPIDGNPDDLAPQSSFSKGRKEQLEAAKKKLKALDDAFNKALEDKATMKDFLALEDILKKS